VLVQELKKIAPQHPHRPASATASLKTA